MAYTLVKYTTKRRYWTICFVENKQTPIKLRMTNKDFKAYYYWLERNYPQWSAINIYQRAANGGRGAFVIQLRKNNYWYNLKNL